MSVSVNTVYQKVLAVLNKEKRGYLPPNEFEYMANIAQMDIFEQYFYDLNQFMRIPGNDTGHADMVSMLQEKIALFQKSKAAADLSIASNKITLTSNDLYRLSSIYVSNAEADKVTKKEAKDILLSPLATPTADRPMYYEEDGGYYVYTSATPLSAVTNVVVDYIKKPADVKWTYTIVAGAPVYNSSGVDLQNFELHSSEETELIYRIIELAGIALKDPSLIQIGGGLENQKVQQEKA
jgi:hypothetical protein